MLNVMTFDVFTSSKKHSVACTCFHSMVCCYCTTACFWMQWPVCWCGEASAPGLGKPSEYLTLQAVVSTRSRLKTCCSLRQQLGRGRQAGSWGPDWLISRSPEVLHSWASSLLSQEPGCYFISTLLQGQSGGEGWMWGEACLILTTITWGFTHGDNCLTSTFCFLRGYYIPCFLKNKGKGVKKV